MLYEEASRRLGGRAFVWPNGARTQHQSRYTATIITGNKWQAKTRRYKKTKKRGSA